MKPYTKDRIVAVCKRNLRLLASAIEVCEDEGAPKGLRQELNYLFDTLFKLMVRYEALPEGCDAEQRLYEELLDITLPIISAYERVWKLYGNKLGEFRIHSPGYALEADSETDPEKMRNIH